MKANMMQMVEKPCNIPLRIVIPSKPLDHNQKELCSTRNITFLNLQVLAKAIPSGYLEKLKCVPVQRKMLPLVE
jgi:hypothetical protein